MIFITAKFQVRPEDAGQWPQIVADFTRATRTRPAACGSSGPAAWPTRTSTSWSRRSGDEAAAGAHVQSEHFRNAQRTLPPHLVRTPRIVNVTVPADDWSLLGELAVPGSA